MLLSLRKCLFRGPCRLMCSVLERMKRDEIIPHVIDEIAMEKMDVCYLSGATVNLGNELAPRQVKDIPIIKWSAHKKLYYTLIMIDPDVPSRKHPDFREWHHWLVVNIPGNDIAKGKTLSHYIGAGPPQGTGLHRYVFLVYKQPKLIKFKRKLLTNTSAEYRGHFCTREFATMYKLGQPIAGNFFQAQWDNYVPLLYKQLGFKVEMH